MKLKCGENHLIGGALHSSQGVVNFIEPRDYAPWPSSNICAPEPSRPSYFYCDDCDPRCVLNISSRHLVVGRTSIPGLLQAFWYKVEGPTPAVLGQGMNCTLVDDTTGDNSVSTDALRSFSKTSVLFVSISFIILMVISLAWLVFYYVQRFRYAHAKDRLQRRLFNAARKALSRIQTHSVKAGDPELDTDCPVCIDPYQVGDVVRMLPCRHTYHKSCIDPWLLEHRTCPMCKADILKHFGYQISTGDASRVEIGRDEVHGAVSPDLPSSNVSDSATFPFQSHQETDNFNEPIIAFAPTPQLVMNNNTAKSFSIVPLTVHSKPTPSHSVDESTQAGSSRGERAASAGVAEAVRTTRSGHVINLVQVRARAQSCTRTVPLVPHGRTSLPSTVEDGTDINAIALNADRLQDFTTR